MRWFEGEVKRVIQQQNQLVKANILYTSEWIMAVGYPLREQYSFPHKHRRKAKRLHAGAYVA
jgi:hypothetical protein